MNPDMLLKTPSIRGVELSRSQIAKLSGMSYQAVYDLEMKALKIVKRRLREKLSIT